MSNRTLSVSILRKDKPFTLAVGDQGQLICFVNFIFCTGDWDERSTQLLIQLIYKYPKTHFLLSMKTEKRMGHWEKLHKEMETAGHTFTILQVR